MMKMKKQKRPMREKTERVAAFEKDEPLQWHDVKCTICMNIFIDPVTFPCKHSVCNRCFNKFIVETSLNCPCCRFRLSVWSRGAIKQKTLVNTGFTERLKKEFPQQIAARLKEIEQEDEEENDSENENNEPRRVNDSGFNDSIFENSQGDVPKVRDADICKPGEIAQEFHKIYDQHQQELDQERQRKEREEEQASQGLIRDLMREEEPYLSQLQSDEQYAKMLAETQESPVFPTQSFIPSPSVLRGANSLASQNFGNSESSTPKSKPKEKNGTLMGISKGKAPKRRQSTRTTSTGGSIKRTCLRSGDGSSTNPTKTKLDKSQTKIGKYFSPSTPSPSAVDSAIEITPGSSSQMSGIFSSSRKLPFTPTPTTTARRESVFSFLTYKDSQDPFDDGEIPGPSSSIRMRAGSSATTSLMKDKSPIKVATTTLDATSPIHPTFPSSSQSSLRKVAVESPSRLHLAQLSLGGTSNEMDDIGGSQSSAISTNYTEEQFELYRAEEEALERFRLKVIQEEEDRKLAEKIQKDFMDREREFRGRGHKESYSIRNWVNGGKNTK